MIKQLQRKFIAIAMVSLLLVMIVVLGAINVTNLVHMTQRADDILNMLSENDGRFPNSQNRKPNGMKTEPATPAALSAERSGDAAGEGNPTPGGSKPNQDKPPREAAGDRGLGPGRGFQISAETPFETRYFVVRTDKAQSITAVDTSHIAAITEAEARQYAKNVLADGKGRGYDDTYRFLVSEQPDGYLLLFVDCRTQMETTSSFFWNSCAISLGSLLVVFILVSVLSRRAIRPVIESMEKQRQFITDAGHEIKTPLAIISANNDVIEMTAGKSEWTASIHNQVNRLNVLVKDLLTLSKLEEGHKNLVMSPVVLSDIIKETVWSFAPLAEKKKIELDLQNIESGIVISGDEAGLGHLAAILLDNAVKYTDEGGRIGISLIKKGRGCLLEVCNTCESVPQGDLSRLFDRFYRADESRSRESGGYGIGLSIAQAIVKTHGGKISAGRKDENTIRFSVEL